MKGPIVLMTDFGNSDYYIGMMKGIIRTIARDVEILDLSHNIEQHNIRQAAFLLATSYKYYPKGSIFVVVVDPQVGTSRKAILFEAGDYYFIGPDNGFATYIIEENPIGPVYSVTNKELFSGSNSSTFHGRDIFAPVSAHLTFGTELSETGEIVASQSLVRITQNKRVTEEKPVIIGEVILIDNFGNLITNIHVSALSSKGKQSNRDKQVTEISGRAIIGLSKTYGDVNKGEFLAYIGSLGYLEIAVNEGNAAAVSGSYIGSRVVLTDRKNVSSDKT